MWSTSILLDIPSVQQELKMQSYSILENKSTQIVPFSEHVALPKLLVLRELCFMRSSLSTYIIKV